MKPACIHDPEQRELALKFIICPLCLSERMGHLEAALAAARASAFRDDCACVECGMHAGDRDRMTADLAAERIENARLREAFVTMERAANQHEADLSAARAVLETARDLPEDGPAPQWLIQVDRAAWLAWQARQT